MGFFVVRFRNGKLDEEERQQGEDGRLHEADEQLEEHERQRRNIGDKEDEDADEDLARKDVPEQPERERYEPRQVADDLEESDPEHYRRLKRNKFTAVFQESEVQYPRDLGDEKRDERERERHVEVGIERPQERRERAMSVPLKKADAPDAGRELDDIRDENEKENGENEGQEAPREFRVLEDLMEVIGNVGKSGLKEGLRPARYEGEPAREICRKTDKKRHDDPAHEDGIGDGEPEELPEPLRRQCDVNPVRHSTI